MEVKLAVYLGLCQKKMGMVFSGPFIQTQALIFFKQLKETGEYSPDLEFAASNGWLDGFKARRNIHYKASRGSTDTIDKKRLMICWIK